MGICVSIPIVLHREALEDDGEEVENIEDNNNGEEGPDGDALPSLLRADAQEEESDQNLDQRRYDDIHVQRQVLPK